MSWIRFVIDVLLVKHRPVCNTECVEHIEEVIRYNGPETIAAIVVEAVTGSSGVFLSPKNYLRRLRDICDSYGILLIVDEVATGFGRTGEWFAVDHWNVVPDILVMGKGITNCYAPLGAVAVRDSIGDFFNERPFACGLTAGAHPLGIAAAVACLEVYKTEKLKDRAKQLGDYQEKRLMEIAKKYKHVQDVRNIGLLGVIELDWCGEKTPNPGSYWNQQVDVAGPMAKILAKLRKLGLSVVSRWNLIFCCTSDKYLSGRS